MYKCIQLIAIALCTLNIVRGVHAQEQTLDDLFPHDRVIEVDITVDGDDWDTIRSQKRDFFEALQPSRQFEPVGSPYTYVEGSVVIDGVTYPRVGIRKKGFIGSQDTDRPSLKIKLDYIDPDGKISGLNNLTFNNNKQDQSLMSQYLTYKLFDAAGSPGSRCAYAKVTVNGENLGVYCHVESMKDQLLQREFGNSDGTLYEGTAVDFYEGWADSFENKSGKDKRGRKHIKKVIETLRDQEGDALLEWDAPGRAWVPQNGDLDNRWYALDFDDSGWIQGRGGAGYEREFDYQRMIGDEFDFENEMFGKATSLYLRFPFDIENLAEVSSARNLLLRIQCDDGFIAYLNGQEVARSNAPENADWRSTATRSVDDRAAMEFASFNLAQHRSVLREGRNVLALHVLNNSPVSSDLLAVAEIQLSNQDFEAAIWELVDEDAFYTFWALEGLLSFWDGYSGNRNNFFIYLDSETEKFHFMPWGTDSVFQTYSPLGIDTASPRSVRVFALIPNRLYQIPQARQRYAAEIKKLMAEHWNEDELLAETERIEAMIEPHISKSQRDSVNFDDIREFIRNRRSVVEPEINGDDMPIWTAGPGGPAVIDRGDFDEEEDRRSIWAAAKRGDILQINELLEKGIDVNELQDGNLSALGFAAMANEIKTMHFLLENGADPSIVGNDFNTPLHTAAFLGRVEAVEVLIGAGANLNKINQDGATPYDAASAPWSQEIEGIVDFVSMFLEIDFNKNDVRLGRIEAAAVIQEHGGESAYVPDWSEEGDIWTAAKKSELKELEELLDDGADPNALDKIGITPLAWSVLTGHRNAAQLLLDRGADVNQPNRDGGTALHGAAFLGKTEMVEFLLANGANANARNQGGETPLDSSAAPWNEEIEGMVAFVGVILEIKVDMARVKKGRPKVAAILREASDR